MVAVCFDPPAPDGRRAGALARRERRGTGSDPSLIEVGFCAAFILMTSQALLGRLGDPAGNGDGALWLRLMWLPAYAVIVGLVVRRRHVVLRLGWSILPIALLAMWAMLSTLWSVSPDVSLRRSLGLACTTAFALYIAARFSWRGLIQLIGGMAAVLALASLIAAAVAPSFAIQDNNGAWRGLWFEKNAMGGFMSRGACACLCAFVFGGPRRQVWLLAAGLCTALTILSSSTTAILTLGLGTGTIGLILLLRRGPLLAVAGSGAAMASVASALVLATFVPGLVFDLTGKDSTLTGRTQLWQAVVEQAAEQPLLGYGYAAFWTDASAPSNEVRARVQWNARNADNGWLDMLVQLGGVGIGLLTWAFALYARRGVSTLLRAPEGLWFASSAVVFWTASLSESVLARSNDCAWIFFVATLGKLSALGAGSGRRNGRRSSARTAERITDSPRRPPAPITRVQLSEILQLGRYAATRGSSAAGVKVIEALPRPLQGYLALHCLGPGSAQLVHPLIRAEAIADIIDHIVRDIGDEGAGGRARRRKARRLLHALATAEMADAAAIIGLGSDAQTNPDKGVALEAQLRAAYPQIWALLSARMAHNHILNRQAARSAWNTVEGAIEALSPSMVLRCIAQATAQPPLPK